MKNNRIPWIDVARGIGIILVLYGHAINGDSYRHLIYAFHMPLFFFISGMVFHPKKTEQFVPFLKKSIMTILVPYLFFALFTYGLWWIEHMSAVSFSDFLRHMYGILYGNGTQGRLFYNVALWFLPCLFITRIAYAALSKAIPSPFRMIVTLLGISALGFIASVLYPNLKLPFGIEIALTSIVFFGTGSLLTIHHKRVPAFFKHNPLILFFLLLSATIIIATVTFNIYGHQIDMRLNRLNHYILFYAAAFGGIAASIYLARGIQTNRILEYIGQNSLILFALHWIVFGYVSRFMQIFVRREIMNEYQNFIFAPVLTIGSIIIILSGLHTYNRIKKMISD